MKPGVPFGLRDTPRHRFRRQLENSQARPLKHRLEAVEMAHRAA